MDTGVYYVAAAGIFIGPLNALGGALTIPESALEPTIHGVALVVLGLLVLCSSIGLAGGRQWGRQVGIVAFAGQALVLLLPLLTGQTLAVPLLGIFVSATCACYLVFATGALESEESRDIDEDTDPHRFVR